MLNELNVEWKHTIIVKQEVKVIKVIKQLSSKVAMRIKVLLINTSKQQQRSNTAAMLPITKFPAQGWDRCCAARDLLGPERSAPGFKPETARQGARRELQNS
jgi:hypothetical protein